MKEFFINNFIVEGLLSGYTRKEDCTILKVEYADGCFLDIVLVGTLNRDFNLFESKAKRVRIVGKFMADLNKKNYLQAETLEVKK